MTASRPPGSSRRGDAPGTSREGANPLDRPLPPGLGRRGAETAAPRAAASRVSAGSHAAPEDSPLARALGEAPPRRSRPAAAPARPSANAAAIPLTAPPAWQVQETQAEERQQARDRAVTSERGLPSWLALVVLLVVTGIGGIIDAVAGAGIKGTFAIGLILGSLAAILLVRRSAMFPVVVAPPLVYFVASAVLLYVRSGGLSNRAAITDAAASWLVYGFPAIAGATAVVLIVAGSRMILRR